MSETHYTMPTNLGSSPCNLTASPIIPFARAASEPLTIANAPLRFEESHHFPIPVNTNSPMYVEIQFGTVPYFIALSEFGSAHVTECNRFRVLAEDEARMMKGWLPSPEFQDMLLKYTFPPGLGDEQLAKEEIKVQVYSPPKSPTELSDKLEYMDNPPPLGMSFRGPILEGNSIQTIPREWKEFKKFKRRKRPDDLVRDITTPEILREVELGFLFLKLGREAAKVGAERLRRLGREVKVLGGEEGELGDGKGEDEENSGPVSQDKKGGDKKTTQKKTNKKRAAPQASNSSDVKKARKQQPNAGVGGDGMRTRSGRCIPGP
ncbi:hypothetical protein K470DRAFT_265169 [Piedraia hortae CBS 480.64]|uniref:Uncharacterized protein n=1 Tax=Piedraia hortae CBS 480.64 TaxID=1314780 RepID=A0A6A7BX77_9PEZI|nr:hypothetical protein K470DRAFT_265169 [Piedraia hortae CBS 480.64]